MRKTIMMVFLGVFLLAPAAVWGAQDPCKGQPVCQRPDGTVPVVVNYILGGGLKHPDTYEPLLWGRLFVEDVDGYWVVGHKWRAKNDFGMYITLSYVFVMDIYGNVIETIEDTRR